MQQIKERGALPMIDRGDIRQATDRCNIQLHCRVLVILPEYKADSLIAKFKEAAERSERLMYEQSHRDYLRSGYLHHRLPAAGLLIGYRDNAITYKAQRDKNARELEAGERGNYRTCRCVSACCYA